MTWTNAFDVGPCNVIVAIGLTELHNAIMVKGDTVSIGGGANPGPFDLAVSSIGVISLTGAQFGTSGSPLVSIQVIPVTAPTNECRVSGITIDLGTEGVVNPAATGNFNDFGASIVLTGSPPSSWSPDPCVLTTPSVEMTVFGGATAI